MRVLIGNDAVVVSPPFVNDDEEPAATASTPTVTVTDITGTSVSAPTVSAGDETGYYEAALTAATHCADLDVLDLVWSGTVSSKTRRLVQQVEVVGGHLATLPQLRSVAGSGWSNDDLRAVRDRFADIAEAYRGVSFVPRVTRELYTGDGRTSLLLRRREARTLRSLSIGGTAVTVGDVALDGDALFYDAGFSAPTTAGPNIVVVYEHGLDVPPAQVVEACLLYAKAVLERAGSGLSRDAIWSVQDGVTFRMSTSDWAAGRPTGLLGVDELLNSVPDRRLPGIG